MISLGKWNSKHGYFLSWYRIYRKGKWTPFCRVGKRYGSWLGYWKVPKPVSWTLYDHAIVFNGIPSDTQEQTLIDLLKTFGLVPAGNARANATTYELFLEPAPDAYIGFRDEPITVAATHEPRPDWKISIPDGHAGTATITYKGVSLNVISANLHLRGGEAALLTLEVYTQHLEAIGNALGIEIEVVPCE